MTDEPAAAGRERHRLLAAGRLRPRLVVTLAMVAALTSVSVAAVSYALVRRNVLNGSTADAVREARANLVDAAGRVPPSPTPTDLSQITARLQQRGGFEVVAQHPDGTSQSTSISLSDASIPSALRERVAAGRIVVMRTVEAGRPKVVVGGQLVPRGASLYFFFSLDEVDRHLASLRTVLTGVSGALVLLSALVGAVAAASVLRPLRQARDAVRRLESGLLDTRLPDTRLPEHGKDEFADLSRSFNKMADALQASMGELRDLETSHRRFVSNVSHELRTPLTALTTAADVLEANLEGLNAQGKRAARLLAVESRRLTVLTEDLMEISRLDAGVAPMACEHVDLGRAVTQLLKAGGWDDHVEADLPEGMTTYADRRRVHAAVGNLVGNALEHGRPPVRVALVRSDDLVQVVVSDRGEGIASEHLAHVFDRFYKADPSRPRSAGSGLGLAIARENALLHGGDLTVTSALGQGATFTLTLPRLHTAPDGTRESQ